MKSITHKEIYKLLEKTILNRDVIEIIINYAYDDDTILKFSGINLFSRILIFQNSLYEIILITNKKFTKIYKTKLKDTKETYKPNIISLFLFIKQNEIKKLITCGIHHKINNTFWYLSSKGVPDEYYIYYEKIFEMLNCDYWFDSYYKGCCSNLPFSKKSSRPGNCKIPGQHYWD